MSKRPLEEDDPASMFEASSQLTPKQMKNRAVQHSARKRAYVTPISEGFKSEEEVKSCAKRSLASQFEFEAAVTNLPPLREDSLNNLSEQQLEVIKLALPPTCNSHDKGSMPRHLVRVTAAAGTGKTTTLLHLALRCIDLGHSNLTYLTFSKASAKDAHGKIQDILSRRGEYCAINASTLHACAWRLLQEEDESDDDEDEEQQQDESDDDGESNFLNDNAFGALIGKKFDQQIEDHLSRAYDAIDATTLEQKKRTSRKKQLRDQAIFYLKKTFWTFCISKMSLADLKNDYHWARHYYPVKIQFRPGGRAAKLGFPAIYSEPNVYKFYADTCVQLWKYVVKKRVRTFDIVMKQAQLNQHKIKCSALLVDECQDLDACQVDWIDKQLQFGTHVFLVGDAAQTIYSFRGAKSANVMSLPNCSDRFLTKSWRFGPAIARIANIALFAKQNSPQTSAYTTKDRKLWIPYRVEGAGCVDESCSAITESIVENWRTKGPVTLMAYKNATLMMKVIELLGLGYLKVSSDTESLEECPPDSDSSASISELLPKFHINGNGEDSGPNKWKAVLTQLTSLYLLYMGQINKLPKKEFPEFIGDYGITWNSFLQECNDKEITKYVPSVTLIHAYEENTLTVMKAFEKEVVLKNHTAEEADIVLSTCHSAKGMEWDSVELLDDFLDLSSIGYNMNHNTFCKKWQFDMLSYGDNLNLLYVALTRAKKKLCVPKSIMNLIHQFDLLHKQFRKSEMPSKNDKSIISLGKRQFSALEGWHLHDDLCMPLRKELEVPADSSISKLLFSQPQRGKRKRKLH